MEVLGGIHNRSEKTDRGYKRIVVFDGDLTELDTQKRSIQLTSMNKNTILSMVMETILPLISIADAVYIMRGTAAHTGKSAWSEEAIAKDIDNAVSLGMVIIVGGIIGVLHRA